MQSAIVIMTGRLHETIRKCTDSNRIGYCVYTHRTLMVHNHSGTVVR